MDISISSNYIVSRFSQPGMAKRLSPLKKPYVYHTIFWMVYFALNTLRWGSYFDDYVYSIKSNLVEFPIHIALVYLNLYYLLPKFIPKSFLRYFLLLILATLTFSLLRIVITYELVTTNVWMESGYQDMPLFDPNYILAVFIGEMYVVGLTTSIKITMDYVKNQKKTRSLEKQHLETELAMLKSQLQPHFFFNTLNNLYSLTLDKSDQAPETVLKLSELMSYVIYQANQPRVPLSSEIKHIQNYLDLGRLRYGSRLDVDVALSGEINAPKIPPLILLPFIENAFKHGAEDETGHIPIQIGLAVHDQYLTFNIKNRKVAHTRKNNGIFRKENSGIGLKNTQRRLGLIYRDNYTLQIKNDQEHYAVTLKLPYA